MPIPIFKMATIGMLPSPLKVLYYRLLGAKIGKGVSIGLLSVISAKEIEIGDGCKISPLTFINCRKFKLGKRVRINMLSAIDTGEVYIDNDSVIMEQVVIGGMLTDKSIITIGKRVKIFPYSFLNPTEEITIEDDVGIGGANYIFTHGSWQSILDGFPVGFGPVTIKKGVWFPWRVFVMPNVTVGEYATIGAGSVITKDIPERSLAAGTPAKVLKQGNEYIKSYSQEEKINIVIDILEQFTKYIQYKYESHNETTFNKLNDNKIDILYKGKRRIIFQPSMDNIIDADAVISLEKIPDQIKNKLSESKLIWFDINNKQTFYRKDELWEDIKDFFSRFGIRFEILS